MTTLVEAFLATLLTLGSFLILRALWRNDSPPTSAAASRDRHEPAPEYRQAA